MNKYIRLNILWCFLIGCCFQKLQADATRWVSINTINARPIALGGAFHAIEDAWAAIHWNPATLNCTASEEPTQFSIRLNPLGPAILINDHQSVGRGLAPVALCIPGILFQYDRICIGILTGEEGLSNISRLERKSWINANGYEWSRNIDIAIRLQFAPRVSMGVALQSVYQHPDDGVKRWGYRYGILVKPKPYLQFGLCYYNFDNRISETRIHLERIPDETLNIGFAFQPWSQIRISADIRNVSDDSRSASLEPHLGLEVNPFQKLSLRGGYFHRQDTQSSIYCMGFGLKCQTSNFGTRIFSNIQWGLDFSYVLEDVPYEKIHWNFLSFYITL